MLAKDKAKQIEQFTESICSEVSCRVYDLDYIYGSKTLQVFIEKIDGNVDLEDCAYISRKLSAWLDEVDIFTNDYNLEVSSPGLERHLKKDWHYNSAIGKTVQMKLFDRLGNLTTDAKKLEKAKNLKGKLNAFDKETLTLEIDGQEFTIPFSGVSKAQLVFETN